jgi:hypothetical protein
VLSSLPPHPSHREPRKITLALAAAPSVSQVTQEDVDGLRTVLESPACVLNSDNLFIDVRGDSEFTAQLRQRIVSSFSQLQREGRVEFNFT